MSDNLPLAGKNIIVTRARHQASTLEDLIRECGGNPIAYPCISIVPPAEPNALNHTLRNARDFDWLALTSSNAVRTVAEVARALGTESDLVRMKIATLGTVTSGDLRRLLDRDPDFTPTVVSAESLARELPLGENRRVLLPQSNLSDAKAADILRARGAAVTAVVAYRTVVGSGGADLPSLLEQACIDAFTFASPSAVRYFRQRCQLDQALNLPVVCLGPVTARSASEYGFAQVIRPPEVSVRAMVSALCDFFNTGQVSR